MIALSTIFSALVTVVSGRVAQFAYVGCFVDDFTGAQPRDLNGLLGVSQIGGLNYSNQWGIKSSGMSREFCSSVCSLGGFAYFGVQLRESCFCGNSFGSLGAADESTCTMACMGNPKQLCGGGNRNSVFAQTYPSRNFFTKVSKPTLTVTSNRTSYSAGAAKLRIECMAQCEANSDCQAVMFSEQQQLCYRLRWALLPGSLTGMNGDYEYYARG